jgi:hypothetical protein
MAAQPSAPRCSVTEEGDETTPRSQRVFDVEVRVVARGHRLQHEGLRRVDRRGAIVHRRTAVPPRVDDAQALGNFGNLVLELYGRRSVREGAFTGDAWGVLEAAAQHQLAVLRAAADCLGEKQGLVGVLNRRGEDTAALATRDGAAATPYDGQHVEAL